MTPQVLTKLKYLEFRTVSSPDDQLHLQYRMRPFQVDASGAFCGLGEFEEWIGVQHNPHQTTITQGEFDQLAAQTAERIVVQRESDQQVVDHVEQRTAERTSPGANRIGLTVTPKKGSHAYFGLTGRIVQVLAPTAGNQYGHIRVQLKSGKLLTDPVDDWVKA